MDIPNNAHIFNKIEIYLFSLFTMKNVYDSEPLSLHFTHNNLSYINKWMNEKGKWEAKDGDDDVLEKKKMIHSFE